MTVPRLRVKETELLRHATWLELFYDLVFIVAIAQLAHLLDHGLSGWRVLGYLGLFAPVWWAWTGQTFYANRFDTDDIGHRLLVALQLLAVGGMAASVADIGERSGGFALSYIAVRSLLIVEYLRARRHVPEARELVNRYLAGFSISVLLWLTSLAVPAPGRYAVWALAMIIDLGTPLTARHYQATLPPQPQHLPERFGLFVVIALGESVAGIVTGLDRQRLAGAALATAGAGVVVAISLWWLYFDNIDESVVSRTRFAGHVWMYSHLILLHAITAVGVAVEYAIAHDPLATSERWLLGLAVTGALLVLALLRTCSNRRYQELPRLAIVAAVLATTGLAGAWPSSILLIAVAALCAAQIALGAKKTQLSS